MSLSLLLIVDVAIGSQSIDMILLIGTYTYIKIISAQRKAIESDIIQKKDSQTVMRSYNELKKDPYNKNFLYKKTSIYANKEFYSHS